MMQAVLVTGCLKNISIAITLSASSGTHNALHSIAYDLLAKL